MHAFEIHQFMDTKLLLLLIASMVSLSIIWRIIWKLIVTNKIFDNSDNRVTIITDSSIIQQRKNAKPTSRPQIQALW